MYRTKFAVIVFLFLFFLLFFFCIHKPLSLDRKASKPVTCFLYTFFSPIVCFFYFSFFGNDISVFIHSHQFVMRNVFHLEFLFWVRKIDGISYMWNVFVTIVNTSNIYIQLNVEFHLGIDGDRSNRLVKAKKKKKKPIEDEKEFRIFPCAPFWHIFYW